MAFPFKYVLAENEIQVALGRWVCARLPYDNIKSIHVTSVVLGATEKYPNFLPWPELGLQIKKKYSFIENFYITPENPQNFALELAEKARISDFTLQDPYEGKLISRIIKLLRIFAMTIVVLSLLAGVIALFFIANRIYRN